MYVTPVSPETLQRLRALFAEPVVDLGADDARYRGIVTPRAEHHAEKRGVTSQFLEHAAEYDRRYANVEHFRTLIDNALAVLRPPIQPRTILDIGSGSGNSVIPLLDRFQDAFVVATDISPQLLAILRDYLEARPDYRGRYALVCMDACNDRYRAGVFDLAVGAAILHHVIEPERVVRACERALAPGGAAIFFEPFAIGNGLLRLAYDDIAKEAVRRGDDSRGLVLLRQISADYAARARDSADPSFLALDDKWMFTRRFFESFCHRGEWAECRVMPIHGDTTPLTDQTRSSIVLAGMEASELPAWAWTSIARFENAFPPPARAELWLECAVVLRTESGERIAQRAGSGWWWNPAESGRGFFFERRDDLTQLVCCAYDDDGEPVWHATDRVPVAARGDTTASLRPFYFLGGVRATGARSISVSFDGERKISLDLGAGEFPLQPQYEENPGFAGPDNNRLTGYWIEDAAEPAYAVVVESIDDRLVAALLSRDDWVLSSAFRSEGRCYRGDWLRFGGGQSLCGPYRPPSSALKVGDARLVWPDSESVLIRLPNGQQRVFVRPRVG